MSDLISRKWLMECVDEGWIKFDTEKDTNTYIHLVRDIAPSVHPSSSWIHENDTIQPKAIRPKFVAEDRYLKNYFQTFPHCPKCNYELETGDCYCRVCGCHIDWSEDDEE